MRGLAPWEEGGGWLSLHLGYSHPCLHCWVQGAPPARRGQAGAGGCSAAIQELVMRARGPLLPLPQESLGVAGAEQGAPPALMIPPHTHTLGCVQPRHVIKLEETAPGLPPSLPLGHCRDGAKFKVGSMTWVMGLFPKAWGHCPVVTVLHIGGGRSQLHPLPSSQTRAPTPPCWESFGNSPALSGPPVTHL